MSIELNDSIPVGSPVLRQQRIGELAAIAIIRTEQRQRLRRNQSTNQMEPIPNGIDQRTGLPKYKQEMVVHGITLPGTTMEAKLGEQGGTPAPGDRVRLILKAKGFGDWIEARRHHRGGKIHVGDVLTLQTEHAQQYDQAGNPKGPKITDQATADATPRGVTIGFYGGMALAPNSDPAWIAKAEEAYLADQSAEQERRTIALNDDTHDEHGYHPAPPAASYGPPPMAPPPATPAGMPALAPPPATGTGWGVPPAAPAPRSF
jgi:hypothetical protein